MKERPILFSSPMVRAILNGNKTQTRRTIKLPPAPMSLGKWEPTTIGGGGAFRFGKNGERISVPEQVAIWHTRNGKTLICPYEIGDRLWVRESFSYQDDDGVNAEFAYMADHRENAKGWGWTPSIHMPRCASRITLEITGIRVERLQDISDRDAKAEGANHWPEHMQATQSSIEPYRHGFWRIWQSINGKDSWEENPWVWVIEFKRVKP